MVAALLLALSPVSADAHGTGGGHGGGGHAGGGPVMNKPAETDAAMAEAGYGGHGWGRGCPYWDPCLWGYDYPYYTPAYPMYAYDMSAAVNQLRKNQMDPRPRGYVPVSRFPPH